MICRCRSAAHAPGCPNAVGAHGASTAVGNVPMKVGPKRISIADARRLCESCLIDNHGTGIRPRGVIILAFARPGQPYAAASYGATKRECRELGEVLDDIVGKIRDGEIPIWHSGEEDGTDYERPGDPIVDAPCGQHSEEEGGS